MTWEWSHTEDAYGYAEEQLKKLPRTVLTEIAHEWAAYVNGKASEKHEADHEDDETIPPFTPPIAGNSILHMGCSELSDFIWEHASSWDHGRRASNGGHELYLCPDGCHSVDLRDMPQDWTPED